MPHKRGVCAVTLICLALGLASASSAQSELPLGTLQTGRATSDMPAEYRHRATSAGVLTVAVQGEGDLVLVVLDADGQPLADGRSDRDMGGNPGLEMATVTLVEPGDYRVQVQAQWGTTVSSFGISASWMPFPAFARPADPDGRPSRARFLKVGEAVEDSLNGSQGDRVDWFAIKAPSAGTLVAVTRAVGDSEADLVLEAFLEGSFGEAVSRSDQDLQGSSSAESVSVNVSAGQTVYLRVTGAFESVEGRYRLSSSLME